MVRIPALLAFTAALASAAEAQEPPAFAFREEAGLRWACGGVGADERAALRALAPEANLELLFVSERRGGYVADVALAVKDAEGSATLLQLRSDGPICLLGLPTGRYRVEATYRDARRTAAALAGAAGKGPQVILRFPEEPWDGTRASEEEKRQARE